MAHDAGKGAKPRPYSISQLEYVTKLYNIFEKKREERETEVPKCPVCEGTMHTRSNWRFFYCDNADCNGSIHKG